MKVFVVVPENDYDAPPAAFSTERIWQSPIARITVLAGTKNMWLTLQEK